MNRYADKSATIGAEFLDQKVLNNVNKSSTSSTKPRIDREWPEPQPLTAKIEEESYPTESLPISIRDAVDEVYGFVKAPLPLVAASAISAVSLVIQAHYDVERASALHSPTGTFMLTIADSGERKSTCDKFFTKAIIDYEDAQAEASKPAIKNYNADMDSWEAKEL